MHLSKLSALGENLKIHDLQLVVIMNVYRMSVVVQGPIKLVKMLQHATMISSMSQWSRFTQYISPWTSGALLRLANISHGRRNLDLLMAHNWQK